MLATSAITKMEEDMEEQIVMNQDLLQFMKQMKLEALETRDGLAEIRNSVVKAKVCCCFQRHHPGASNRLPKTYSQIKVRSLVHSESKSQITKSVHQNGP